MTDSVWHFLEDGEEKGPVSSVEIEEMIRDGRLRGERLVWASKLSAWTPLYKVETFAEALRETTHSIAAPKPRPKQPSYRAQPVSGEDRLRPPPAPNAGYQQLWHFLEDGEQQGPVTASDLREMIRDGRLTLDTRVWSPGLTDWTAIEEAETLSDLAADLLTEENATQSPEVRERPRTCPYCAQPAQPEALVCRHCGRQMVGNWFARGPKFIGNRIAGFLSLFIPGLGQLFQGRYSKAHKYFGLAVLFWLSVALHPIFVFLPLMFHLRAFAEAWVYSPLEQKEPKTPAEDGETVKSSAASSASSERVPVVTHGVEVWPGSRDGWLAYMTIQHSGQPEDKIPLPEFFRTQEEAMKRARLTAHLYLQRLLDGS